MRMAANCCSRHSLTTENMKHKQSDAGRKHLSEVSRRAQVFSKGIWMCVGVCATVLLIGCWS